MLSKPIEYSYGLSNFESDRVNGMLNLQWAPSETITATVDYIYSSKIVEGRYNSFGAWFNGGPNPKSSSWDTVYGVNASPAFYSEDETRNPDITHKASYFKDRNKNNSTGLNIEWQTTDSLALELDYHKSTAQKGSMSPNTGTIAFASYNRKKTTTYQSGEMGVLEIDMGTLPDGSPRPLYKEDMIISGSQFGNDASDMQIEAARFSGIFDLSESTTIDFGVELNEVSNRSVGSLVENGTWSGVTDIEGDLVEILERRSITSQLDGVSNHDDERQFDEFFTVDFEDLRQIAEQGFLSGRYDGALNSFGNCNTPYCDTVGDKLNVAGVMIPWDSDLQTTEESKVAYLQINHSTELSDMPVNIRAGVRYEETDVASRGNVPKYTDVSWTNAANEIQVSASEAQLVDDIGSYDLLLPNLDFDISVTDEIVLRASVSKTATRPNYDQIKGGAKLGGLTFKADQDLTASGGNPGLEPIESTNFDLSSEWYYGEESYFSIGYFKKDVKNFIAADKALQPERYSLPNPLLGDFWLQAVEDANDVGITAVGDVFDWIKDNRNPSSPELTVNGDNVTINGVDGDPLVPVIFDTMVNINDAKISGWEFALQHNFDDTGYGVILNYTLAEANINYDNSIAVGAQFVINGLSDSANFIGFYDQDGLQARVAYNWRDAYLAGVGQPAAGSEPTNVRAYGQWDFNVSYEYDDNFTVFVEGLNVTNSIVRNYGRTESMVLGVYQGGARYNFGARYKF